MILLSVHPKVRNITYLPLYCCGTKSILSKHIPKCLVLHPVTFPNRGPIIEQYLASQAIGLVSSLNWQTVPGPFWKLISEKNNLSSKVKNLPRNTLYIETDNQNQIKDGTYLKTSVGNGIYYKNGIIFEADQSQSDGDLHQQWQNKKLRESLANLSLIKCRRITQKCFFTKGKLQAIIEHIVAKQVQALFINAELKPGQIRNLKKIIQAKLNNKNPPKGYINVGMDDNSQTQLQSTEEQQNNSEKGKQIRQNYKRIQIFDRFSIILQIFAKRTTSKLAKLQIQLSYLSYLKTRLVRDGSTYSSNLNLFTGNLLNSHQISLEIISAKQRKAIGIMSGEGQSQLEIQRRNIKNKEAKIRKEIESEAKLRENKKEKDKTKNFNLPIIALVGYTNVTFFLQQVGKSAFLNYVVGKNEVESKDLLFQTLKTVSRYIMLPSGNKAILMDTIGFITDLPVQMIDAFKATLEDISHADLVIHLRDISHPQNQLQKQSVITILKELNIAQDFYTDKMIEVWNKVDLVEDSEVTEQNHNQSQIKISCTTGKNMGILLQFIDQKLKKIRNIKKYKVTYGYQHHYKVIEWLRSNANISYSLHEEHNYEKSDQYPTGSVTILLQIDEIVHNKFMRYVSQFTHKGSPYKKDKSKKGMPPKQGW